MVLLETTEPPLRDDVSVQVGLDREQSIRALRAVLKSRCASICSAVGLIHSCVQTPSWTFVKSLQLSLSTSPTPTTLAC